MSVLVVFVVVSLVFVVCITAGSRVVSRVPGSGGGLVGYVVGRRQTGAPLVLPAPSGDPLHMLVGGQTGAGKSVLLQAILSGLAPMADVAIVGMDPKRTALGMWRPRATLVAKSIPECTAVLVMLWREVHRRLEVMEHRGVDEWSPGLGGPFIVLVIDELTEVVAPDGAKVSDLMTSLDRLDPSSSLFKENTKALREAMSAAKTGKEAQGLFLASLARICRSSGVQLITATQYPETNVLDPQFRANMSIRVMLRVASNEMVKVILGAGRTDDITADSISYEEQGGFWIGGLEGRPVRARGLWIKPNEARARALQTAGLRHSFAAVFPDQTPPPDLDNHPAQDPDPQPTPTSGNSAGAGAGGLQFFGAGR